MSSTSIYPHVPYFYIIEHTPSGKRYGGAKWGKDANPNTFMIEGGYTTSSNIVNDLIKKDGLESFTTKIIITEFGTNMSAYEYETMFLQTNDIADNNNWLNGHNNSHFISHGTDEFKNIMLKLYGVEYAMQHPTSREKAKITSLERYGVEYAMQSQKIKDKHINTILEKYGVINVFQSDLVKDIIKNTTIMKFGVDHYSKTEKSKKESKERNTGSVRWNDGINEYKVYAGETPESHWIKGGLPRRKFTTEEKEAKRNAVKGSKWFNDGIRSYQVRVGKTPEPHWVIGRI